MKTTFVIVSLYLVVVVLALMVVNNRHQARQLFVELQTLEKERDRLNEEWSRLKLQQSTNLSQAMVDTRAKEELGLIKPSSIQMKVIRE